MEPIGNPIAGSGPSASATDMNPVALERFELVPEPVPAEVLGAKAEEFSMEVWALRIHGAPVRELLTEESVAVASREYVFAAPIDVIGKLARELAELYERQHSSSR